MLGYYSDPIFQEHRNGDHPEQPGRLVAIDNAVQSNQDLAGKLSRHKALPGDPEDVLLIHDLAYVKSVEARCLAGYTHLDVDTGVCRDSYRVALAAATTGLDAVDKVLDKTLDQAFIAMRPPGHHAEHDRSMGFCLFNNIAIAARHLQQRRGLERIAIFDFDVHHGNGTMHSFWKDPGVFYGSVHMSPLFPGTGSADQVGGDQGRGFTLNMPLPLGARDQDYLDATSRFLDKMVKFRPDMILLSAGFDAHREDPLAGHSLTDEAFHEMGRMFKTGAEDLCQGRIAAFLEGGYNLAALGRCVTTFLESWV